MKVLVAIVWLWVLAFVCHFMKICKKPIPSIDGADYYRRACEVAGAKYVGIQEIEGGDNLVLFNSLKTNSTLAVKEKDFSATAVEMRLERHDRDREESYALLHV